LEDAFDKMAQERAEKVERERALFKKIIGTIEKIPK
jgi:hypothetical protein